MIYIILIIGFYLIVLYSNNKENSKPVTLVEKSHNDILNSLKTKDDVIKYFGIPDSKKELNGYEEWIFLKGKTIKSNSTTESSEGYSAIGGAYLGIKNMPIATGTIQNHGLGHTNYEMEEVSKHIKFIFQGDEVIKNESVGVDLTSYRTITTGEWEKEMKSLRSHYMKVEMENNNSSIGNKFTTIKSPINGTFYRQPGPNKHNFVNEEDLVSSGKVLCTIENTGLFYEITSPINGQIVNILAKHASKVEYDQPLFIIEKL